MIFPCAKPFLSGGPNGLLVQLRALLPPPLTQRPCRLLLAFGLFPSSIIATVSLLIPNPQYFTFCWHVDQAIDELHTRWLMDVHPLGQIRYWATGKASTVHKFHHAIQLAPERLEETGKQPEKKYS